jgi:hypothetical protein
LNAEPKRRQRQTPRADQEPDRAEQAEPHRTGATKAHPCKRDRPQQTKQPPANGQPTPKQPEPIHRRTQPGRIEESADAATASASAEARPAAAPQHDARAEGPSGLQPTRANRRPTGEPLDQLTGTAGQLRSRQRRPGPDPGSA